MMQYPKHARWRPVLGVLRTLLLVAGLIVILAAVLGIVLEMKYLWHMVP